MHPPRGSPSRYRAGYLLLCRIMHPRALLIQHLGGLQGVLWLANTQQKEKQKALLGKRVRVGDSCYSSVWYSQRLVGAVEQRGTGGLCSAGCEGRSESVKSRASKSVQSHSKRGQWKLGQEEKTFELLECTPQTDCVFSGWKTEELHCKSPCFSSLAGHALISSNVHIRELH